MSTDPYYQKRNEYFQKQLEDLEVFANCHLSRFKQVRGTHEEEKILDELDWLINGRDYINWEFVKG